jgi:2-polyprenyl-3-methyl-5-hydroxy-6-metoxy-1,4-benzoquinol methylase
MDDDYTLTDHEFRTHDSYAAGKYDLTIRWLHGSAPKGARLYNIGCGAGLFNELAADAGFDVTGFEPDETAFQIAKGAADGWNVENKGLDELAGAEPADVVVMHDVLEHIEFDVEAGRVLHGLVRPTGILAISVPALPRLFGLHDEQLGHFRRYTKSTLAEALAGSFTFDRLRYYGFTFVPVTWWLSRVRRRPYPVEAVADGGGLSRAVDMVTAVESRIPAPIGTSLVGLAHRSDA